MIPIVTFQENGQCGVYLSEKRIYGLIQKSKTHQFELYIGDWMAIIHFIKFIFGVPALYHHYMFRTDSVTTILTIAIILLTVNLVNLHTILNCCTTLYIRRSNTEVFDLSDLAEEAFKDHNVQRELMFRFRWCTFMRYFVKLLLITNCISCSYLLYNNCIFGMLRLMEERSSSRETLIVCFLFCAIFIACLPDSLFHLLPLSVIGVAVGIVAMLMGIYNLLTMNISDIEIKPVKLRFHFPKMDTFFPYPFMCNLMPILLIIRAELKPRKLLHYYKFTTTLFICITVVVFHIYSYIAVHIKSNNFDILQYNVTHADNKFNLVMAVCYRVNQLLTIPLYIYALIKITKNMRNDYRETSMQKLTRRCGWLAMFIILILTKQARAYCKYIASVSGVLLSMVMPSVIEWRLYVGGRLVHWRLRYIKISIIMFIAGIVLTIILLDITCRSRNDAREMQNELLSIFQNGSRQTLAYPLFLA